jgi:hypothetical protein
MAMVSVVSQFTVVLPVVRHWPALPKLFRESDESLSNIFRKFVKVFMYLL